MFGYLRLFAIISLILITGFTTLAGASFRNLAMDDLTRLVEKNNASIAQGYVNAVWLQYREVIFAAKTKTAEEIRTDPQIIEFAQETVRYFKKMQLLRVNIYGGGGNLLLSTTVNQSSVLSPTPPSPDTNFILNQIRGTAISSQMIHITRPDGEPGIVFQTLVPIDVAGTNSEGAVELLYDVTAPWDKLSQLRFIGTLGIIGVFVLFLLLLFFMSQRAEAIITKQHEANIDLASAAATAQAESRDKSQFLANISHELRTPLNAIIGFSEIIKNGSFEEGDGRKHQAYINDIHTSGVHLLSLINDILDYSKAEAGKLELEVSEVNVNRLVQNCIRLVGPRAEAAEVEVVEALPKEVITMITDSKKFKQIMLNLLSNAVKFTPPGGVVRVTAWAEIADGSFSFEVRDSGIGIAPKDISRAMAPFGQVDNTLSRKYDGTGLGLPLTKKFVELMGGKLTIESELNVGTAITFNLPREVVAREGVTVKQVG